MTTIGRYIYDNQGRPGWGGISGGDPVEEFVRTIQRYGHATVDEAGSRPTNHYIAGIGIGHQDDRFAEIGQSMAAYYENGEAHGGLRWWEDTDQHFSIGVKHYGCQSKVEVPKGYTAKHLRRSA